jgi:pimeloyl-ACP methyl ester carboxylesterase
LTGIGERAHLTSPQVDLTTHIRDVVNVILYEDLADIVLLGYSYGGFVVTGALEHIAARVRHLVYLDAFVPDDGDTVLSLMGREGRAIVELGEAWLVPPPTREYDDPEEAAFAEARRTPHPIDCFTEPVHVCQQLESYPFTRTYIKATAESVDAPSAKAFWAAADRAKSESSWRYREVATNHMIPSNRPRELAELLLELS